jgi:hypothetical protein
MAIKFLIGFCMLFSVAVSAQKTNIWRGGAPGHETDWLFFKNWSSGTAPDEFDYVIIPDVSTASNKYPVILAGNIEVLGLEIQSGATLILHSNARLSAQEVNVLGRCKGCGRRILLEGTAEVTAFNPKK